MAIFLYSFGRVFHFISAENRGKLCLLFVGHLRQLNISDETIKDLNVLDFDAMSQFILILKGGIRI